MSAVLDIEPSSYEVVRAEPRPFGRSLWRGFLERCPNCGKGKLFRASLKVADECPHCGEALHHHQADDAPPYFTILIVGHVVVPIMLAVELEYAPAVWIQMIAWPTLTAALSLLLLPRIKGAVVGWQWAQRMHGFGGETHE
ncbi:DUF983 domain-containing protein [Parvibaculum sp.]|uniref:DUF983 domain-containing protein n=1 Tax=Parvibaculum sp. TaxID=2024848 RepID=UPI002C6EE8D1|nr:DUF983 domain-containing protein [Parvibaculum sp.]HUD52210.1 DUF983 domain-containing protein [Parvibaculum sp.]